MTRSTRTTHTDIADLDAAHAKQDAVPLRDALRKLLHAAGDYKKITEAVKRVCP